MKIICPCCQEEINLSLFITREIKEQPKKSFDTTHLTFIKEIVCHNAGIEEEDFHKENRSRELVKTRKQFCYLAKKYTKASHKQLGEFIRQGFDHSTVTHMLNGMNDLLSAYEQDRREMEYLIDKVE